MTGTGRAPPNVSAFRVLVSQVLLPVKSYKEESYEENICFIAKNDLNKNAFSSGICRNIFHLRPKIDDVMSAHLKQYLSASENALKAGTATEGTHRPALKTLLESLAPDIIATNEPHGKDCRLPDFMIFPNE